MSLVLLARDQQGLAAHEKGVKAGAKVSPAQVVHSPSSIVLQGLSGRDRAPQQPQARQGYETLLPLGSPDKGCRRQSCGVRLRSPDRTGNRHLHSTAQGRAEGPEGLT